MPRWASLAAEDGVMEMTMPKSAAYRLSDDEKENNNGGALMHSNGVESPSNGFKYSDCEDSIGKESGGRSGRRKQSKPARVFLDMEGGGAEGEAAAPPASAALASKEKTEVDMETELSCDLCNDSFPSQNELTEHIQVTHTLPPSESAQTNMELYPTKYHRLGSELQQEVVFPTPIEAKVDLSQSERESRPSSNSSESQNGSTGSKARIFHQDAYCKLCDREFCNKYFLKIHMANKHGIFEDGASPGSVNGTDLPPIKPVLSESPPALITHPTPPKPALVAIPSTPPKPTSTVKGSTKKDMEDYCEICQKHFCNKYYLRKHKNDVHGIAPDVVSNSSKKGRPTNTASSSANSSSSSSNISSPPSAPLVSSNSLASVITTSSTNPLLMPPLSTTASSLPSMSGASSMPGLNSMANVMFINPFAPPVAILQAQPVLQSGSPAFPPPPHLGSMPSMPQVPISSSSSSAPESPKATSASSASPGSRNDISAGDAMRNLTKGSSRSNDSLRSMGILNADAYCEICRKEFCNKYFLGIHKANKHGIYTDEALNPLLLPGMTPGMPENLSMRSIGDLGDKEKMELSKIKTEGVPTSEEVCEICKKEFNNKFSLKIHLVNAHNIKPQDFDLGLELFKQDKINGNQAANAGGSMFGNMMAAKMADRVTCDICNKEVCNKYFLKTHKIKVHGIDPIEAEKELEAKTTPTKAGTPATGNASSPAETAKEALQRPNDEELLKMGIDPEAYCEICRKEFCSKYFLKTHKANIHGIKVDSTPVPAMPALPIPSLKFHDQSLLRPQLPFGLPQSGASMVPLPGALPLLDPRSSPENDVKSENKWMWKEPSNQTRVMCEICNKELCNKYFLKTHLMKKHGISYDISTGQMMPKEKENPPTSTPQAPVPAPQEKESPKGDTAPDSMDSTNTVVSAKTWSIPSQLPLVDKIKMDQTEIGPRQTCTVCGISFGEKVTLQFHLIKDHGAEVTIPSAKEEASDEAKDQVKRAKKERSTDSNKKACSLPADQEADKPRKKKFRCVHCQQRFNSRARCKSHIRATHASNLKPRQAFNIQGSEHLFPSDCKVQLPVLQNIREPITVTLFPANV